MTDVAFLVSPTSYASASPATGSTAPRYAGKCEATGDLFTTSAPIGLTLAAVFSLRCKGRNRQVSKSYSKILSRVALRASSEDTGPSLAAKSKRAPRWAPGGSNNLDDKGKTLEPIDAADEEIIPGEGRCFRVTYEFGIGIRDGPSLTAKRTGIDLQMGEVFEIKTEIRRGGRRYLELVDGRGWAFDWSEIEGERIELVEIAAQLYTVIFPEGVNGIGWGSDNTMRFCFVQSFTNEAEAANLTAAGLCPGDILVLINEDPVVGMPFGQVLERLWATAGRQPGTGLFYKVSTTNPYGIGIREEPDIDSARTGEDLLRGSIFQVDEIVETEGGFTYLHLADGRGWVFDTSPIDPENPSVQCLDKVDPGCTLTLWRGKVAELAKTIGLQFKQDSNDGKPFTLTVLEEGQPIQRCSVQPGMNVRTALLKNGFQVYQELRAVFNCNAQQLCGTCVVDVMEGVDNVTVKSVNEQRVMSANPPSYRLCCNMDMYGDVMVRLRPKGVIYGGATS